MHSACCRVGDDDDDEEDSDDDEEDEQQPDARLDAAARSGGRASTSKAGGDDGDSDDDDDDDLPIGRVAAAAGQGSDADAGTRAAGGALGPGIDPSDEGAVCGSLFRGLVFFLGREVPREPLMLVVRAFGGKVAWEGEGSPYDEADETITHQVGRGGAGRDGRGASGHGVGCMRLLRYVKDCGGRDGAMCILTARQHTVRELIMHAFILTWLNTKHAFMCSC